MAEPFFGLNVGNFACFCTWGRPVGHEQDEAARRICEHEEIPSAAATYGAFVDEPVSAGAGTASRVDDATVAAASSDSMVAVAEPAVVPPDRQASSAARPSPTDSEPPPTAKREAEPPRHVLPLLQEPIHLVGSFTNWATNCAETRLQPTADSGNESIARLQLCVQLTSVSFSFQVVSAVHGWNWRLYPADAKPNRWGAHASMEAKLKSDSRDAVVVAVGNSKEGHGLNFHIIESSGAVVTIFVEVPVCSSPSGPLKLRTDTTEGVRVWYESGAAGSDIQYSGGDGVDFSKYKHLARWIPGLSKEQREQLGM
eukprot:gnl/TRDRNA2_/TRDRNA2_193975_c0_seq1.p1 gnl/TRDRNA2_/TRDRNA2_193975_c0~~gnl/TRDRNA2_/TRDRNA2_193975_c0_seq1.p1  ORF type:complete len:312 (+),score=62.28 gnl/TRDRNA2_/TRDRNA2_193975_c0_seq1:33-968(+)